MAQPAANPGPPLPLSINEVRTRLVPLARMTELTGHVTVITDGGRPVAALVPLDAARSRAEARAADTRREAAALGWQERLETVRRRLGAQHRQRAADLRQALRQAWEVIDEVRPAGHDRRVEQVRAQHRDLLTEPE